MSLTLAQRKFFIDPIQDPLAEATSILVLEERYGRGSYTDKITDVRSITTYDNRIWWVSDRGDHVAGAPINPATPNYGAAVLGIITDDLFVVGSFNGVRADNGHANITQAVRSDQLRLPGTPGDISMAAKTWVLAAPWAVELMPKPEDNEAVTSAKLALAQQRWEQRHAKAVILQQALYRDWWDDMETLSEDHDMLNPVLGGLFYGGVLFRVSPDSPVDALSDERKAALKAKTDRALSAASAHGTYTQTTLTLPMRVTVTKPADLSEVDKDTVISRVRNAVSDYDAIVGVYNLSPVLRSAA